MFLRIVALLSRCRVYQEEIIYWIRISSPNPQKATLIVQFVVDKGEKLSCYPREASSLE